MAAIGCQVLLGHGILLELSLQQERVTEILFLQRFQLQPLFAFTDFRKNYLGTAIFAVDGFEDAGITVAQHENAGQQQARQAVQFALNQPACKAGARGHARKQAFGAVDTEQFRPVRTGFNGQARDQGVDTDRPIMDLGKDYQAFEQRVILMMRIDHIWWRYSV